ncbi:MAG: UDP-N-acetylglucosamine 2-epimerase (non-hydrolyzing) [Sedimentisphaerales bacterium]|nr:UDP-N-acetylglucosamine 2-epimerase (non-hydrolyzing) [Sedimentisphaerales bacterium]
MRILSIFGTRPEAIKMAPVVKELQKHSSLIESVVCTTGQHRQMLDQVLSLFEIEPQIDLNLMESNQTLDYLTARAMEGLTKVIIDIKPDIILVQGDTTTAMIASLAGFYQKIAIGHVEAGLRTYNKYSPFPEEINRRLISALATYNFAPTKTAVNALLAEGFKENNIFLTGNTVIDALLLTVKKKCKLDFDFLGSGRKLILVTAHRRENFGKPFLEMCTALKKIAERNDDVDIVYPVHLNPNVRIAVDQILPNTERIHLVEPMEYRKFVHLMNRSYIILTDSGGIQEEAPALGKPVLVMRNDTERPEAVEYGTAKLVGTEMQTIVNETETLLNDENEYTKMSNAVNPFGNGDAAEKIVKVILAKS